MEKSSGGLLRKGFDPAAHDFLRPSIGSRCTKRSTSLGSEPYTVRSIRCNFEGKPTSICVCRSGLIPLNLLTDVVRNCWPGEPPANPKIAREVKMTGFGNVDFVIADIGQGGAITEFLSVELQAIDITGSVMPAYQAQNLPRITIGPSRQNFSLCPLRFVGSQVFVVAPYIF